MKYLGSVEKNWQDINEKLQRENKIKPKGQHCEYLSSSQPSPNNRDLNCCLHEFFFFFFIRNTNGKKIV